MTWWQDEIQQLRQENDQLRQKLANQPSCSYLIAQYLKEKALTEEASTNNPPNDYVQLIKFKEWVEEKATENSQIL